MAVTLVSVPPFDLLPLARRRGRILPLPAVVPLKRSPSASDHELLAAVVAGKPAAIAQLFDRYSRLVRQMLIRTLGSSFDVDDLMQETFLTAIRRAHTLRYPPRSRASSSASPFARPRTSSAAAPCDAGSARTRAAAREYRSGGARRRTSPNRALEQLDPGSRVLFVLRHVEELELSEIALAEGVSLATLKRRLARAERRFEAIAERDPVLRDYLVRPA